MSAGRIVGLLALVGAMVLGGFAWQGIANLLDRRRAVKQLADRERRAYEAAQAYAEQAGDGLWLDPVDEAAAQAMAILTPDAPALDGRCRCALCRLPDEDIRQVFRGIVRAHRARLAAGVYNPRPPVSPGREDR